MKPSLTWNDAFVSVRLARPVWVKDFKSMGPNYIGAFPKGPAYSVSETTSGRIRWKLTGTQLDPSYHEQS